MMQMDLICRTCLACDDEMEPLYSKKLVDTEYIKITEMIMLCTGLMISEDDTLSNTICTGCIESVIAAFKYRKKIWKSHEILIEATKVLDDVPENDLEIHEAIQFEPCGYIPNFSENETTQQEISKAHIIDVVVDKSTSRNENPLAVTTKSNKRKLKQPTGDIDFDGSINNGDLIPSSTKNHKRYKDMDKYIQFSDKSDTRRYGCTICNRTYEAIGSLRKHLLEQHCIPLLKTYNCPTCSKTFVDEPYYRRHVAEAHQPEKTNQNLICDLCGKGFKFACQLVEHVNRHNGVKPNKCDICNFGAVSTTELKLHIRSHTGEKPYVCHICGAGYKSSSHRGAHIKDVHSEGRPHECKICGKNYKSYSVYKSHMNIHNPNQIIKCNICNKEFNYRKNLTVHLRQHGEKSFKCSVCQRAFYQKQNCQTHMKKVHGVKL